MSKTNSEDAYREYNKLKKELEDLYDHRLNGSLIRSRAKWHEKGEKSTKHFFDVKKRNYTKNTCINSVSMTKS